MGEDGLRTLGCRSADEEGGAVRCIAIEGKNRYEAPTHGTALGSYNIYLYVGARLALGERYQRDAHARSCRRREA